MMLKDSISTGSSAAAGSRLRGARLVRWLLLGLAAALFALHFLHLKADFPNDSPWMDWSKYTDEGWYGDAAIRHFLFGHWYFKGDFNPAVALPVWPLLEALVFRFTGVSVVAARALTLCVFGAMLGALYLLIDRFPRLEHGPGEVSLAAPLAVFLFCASPFFYVFERMAILEPLLATLTTVAILVASCVQPWERRPAALREWVRLLWPLVALGLLLPAMVLTKTTAAALVPAVGYMLWYRAGYRLRPALKLALLPLALAAMIWAGYLLLFVRPHYLEDYQYLFSANAYTGFQLQPLATVLFNTFADGHWMGGVLYPAFFVAVVLALFARPAFFRDPLVPTLLLWTGGYFAFLAYHNNLQPRYYLVPAVPITALVALALEEFRHAPARISRHSVRALWPLVAAAVVAAIAVPDVLLQLSFILHPEYTFENAAQNIARIVRSNPQQPDLILSISGSDLTLMTGLPSIDDDFGTLDLDQRVKQYHPGWYVAWNELDDDKMDALRPLYRPVRVAEFPSMDDPERNLLILYRLDPNNSPGPLRQRRVRTPRPLRTRLGQQPTTTQLEH
ncbi:MAG TPA: hypothetical protein VKV02_09045 [Acidobacteriaceae bacterium]|nr:hypothetical protein [Acidobacteriaceae bacterium]